MTDLTPSTEPTTPQPLLKLKRSEALCFYEGWTKAVSFFTGARDVALANHGEGDICYRVLNAVIVPGMDELGKALADSRYPYYEPPPAEQKIPLDLLGQND
jgi:hypothetical protein